MKIIRIKMSDQDKLAYIERIGEGQKLIAERREREEAARERAKLAKAELADAAAELSALLDELTEGHRKEAVETRILRDWATGRILEVVCPIIRAISLDSPDVNDCGILWEREMTTEERSQEPLPGMDDGEVDMVREVRRTADLRRDVREAAQ